MIKQPGNPEGLSILEFDFSLRFARGERRNRETGNGYGVSEIQGTDLRGNMETNNVVRLNDPCEIQSNTERTKLDGDSADVCSALDDRKRKLTASQKTG